MRSLNILYFLACLFLIPSCKQDSGTTQETNTPTENSQPSGSEQDAPATSPAATGGHDYTFLTEKLFHYIAAFGGKSANNAQLYKDEWIDLMPDGNFTAGKLQKQTHTGVWTYNHDTQTLFLKPNDTNFNMSEWKVMYNEQMMVWIGTATYGNQTTQIKLERKDMLPGK